MYELVIPIIYLGNIGNGKTLLTTLFPHISLAYTFILYSVVRALILASSFLCNSCEVSPRNVDFGACNMNSVVEPHKSWHNSNNEYCDSWLPKSVVDYFVTATLAKEELTSWQQGLGHFTESNLRGSSGHRCVVSTSREHPQMLNLADMKWKGLVRTKLGYSFNTTIVNVIERMETGRVSPSGPSVIFISKPCLKSITQSTFRETLRKGIIIRVVKTEWGRAVSVVACCTRSVSGKRGSEVKVCEEIMFTGRGGEG